jgi:hypothetical protein
LFAKVARDALYIFHRHDAIAVRIKDIHRRTPAPKLCCACACASVSFDAFIRISDHDRK